MLLKEAVVIDVNIKTRVKRLELVGSEIVESPLFILTAKTRAFLFTAIDEMIRKKYSDANMPELYSVPIINMDFQQADKLREEITEVFH